MIVMKFGGSSVADREQIDKVAEILRERKAQELFVVFSAHKGVTTQLIESAKAAVSGNLDVEKALRTQRRVCAELGCPEALLEPLYVELEALLRGISLVRELSDRTLDYVASFGERMSVRAIAWYLRSQGIAATPFDAWDLGMITDSEFGQARPLEDALTNVSDILRETDVGIPIVTGFIGKDRDGNITTLGRNGSDFTATLFAEAFWADCCEIWSDTNGVMSADPGLISGARNIAQMTYREASELARFGSRILHPASLEPVARAAIPLKVMNTNAPDHPGTLVNHQACPERRSITSIAYKENQTIITITSSAMFQRSGFLAEVFATLGRHEVVVDMISTSEISLSFSTESNERLDQAMLELSDLGECQVATGKTIVAIVGPEHGYFLRHEIDVLTVLRAQSIDAEMLSLGYESINLLVLIDNKHIASAISSLHDAFFKHLEQ